MTATVAVNGAETWTLREVDRIYVESFKMWCSRKMGGAVRPIVCQKKKYCTESRKTGILHIQYKYERLTGLVTSCIGNVF